MSELRVEHESLGEVAVVALSGELDHAEIDAAEAEVVIAETGAPKVLLLDISGLTFMDSSGVRMILQAEARAAASSRRLAVLAGTGLPARVLSLLGLSDRLELIADRAEVLGPE